MAPKRPSAETVVHGDRKVPMNVAVINDQTVAALNIAAALYWERAIAGFDGAALEQFVALAEQAYRRASPFRDRTPGLPGIGPSAREVRLEAELKSARVRLEAERARVEDAEESLRLATDEGVRAW